MSLNDSVLKTPTTLSSASVVECQEDWKIRPEMVSYRKATLFDFAKKE